MSKRYENPICMCTSTRTIEASLSKMKLFPGRQGLMIYLITPSYAVCIQVPPSLGEAVTLLIPDSSLLNKIESVNPVEVYTPAHIK